MKIALVSIPNIYGIIFQESEAVYEEDMIHRPAGDASSLSPAERRFAAVAEGWVRAEAQGSDGENCYVLAVA